MKRYELFLALALAEEDRGKDPLLDPNTPLIKEVFALYGQKDEHGIKTLQKRRTA